MASTRQGGTPPEQKEPCPMDRGVCSDGNLITACSLHQEGHWNNSPVVKHEPVESSTPWTHEGCHPGVPGCLSPMGTQPLGLWQNSTVPMTEEPEEILPTLTDESVRSEHRGTLPCHQVHLEDHWSSDVVVKKEPEEVPAASTCETFHMETADMLPSCHGHLDEGWADRIAVKEEPEAASASSTYETWHPEAADMMSSHHWHLSGGQADGVVVKEEPEEMLPSPTAENCEDSGEMSPSQLDPEGPGSSTHAAKKGRRFALGVRCSYTIQTKVEVVRWHRENGGNVSKTARHFTIDRKRIRDWNANYQELLQQCHGRTMLRKAMHNGRPVFSKEVDNGLMEFLEKEISEGRAVNNRMLRQRARQLAAELGLGYFRASCQYLTCWKRRFNVAKLVGRSRRRKHSAN